MSNRPVAWMGRMSDGSDRPDPGPTVIDRNVIGAGHVDSPALPPLVDDPAIYLESDVGPVTVTLTASDAQALADIETNATDGNTPVVFTAADYGGGRTAGNGTIELRGSTSRGALQKSFQIELASDATPWRGGRIINLLKHPFDLTRVRNTLSFESFRSISDLVSLRTGFVHLIINSIDRGLYEWVEEPDETFLASRGLDARGSLYEAKTFAFTPIDDATASDPAKVDDIVAARGSNDLAKLRRMLAAVNDARQPIDGVIGHYFNRANYVTWLAVNVLTADYDSGSQNLMLYSPAEHEGWYFLPWDYDGAWGWNEQSLSPPRPRWREGLSNWWWVALHQRFLAEPANLAELDARIRALAATTFADDAVAAKLARYHDVVASFISVEPDINNLPCETAGTQAAIAAWEAEYTRIATNAGRALAEYATCLSRPMPFWLYSPAFHPSGVALSWSRSYQLQGQPLRYDIEINASETFDPAATVATKTGLAEPLFTAAGLAPGHYFWRAVARSVTNPAHDWQMAFNDHLSLDVT